MFRITRTGTLIVKPNGTRFTRCHFGAQKVSIAGPNPFNGYCLHQNHYVPRH